MDRCNFHVVLFPNGCHWLTFFWFYALETVLRHLTIAVGGPDKQSQSQSLPTYDKKKLTLSKHNDPVVEKYHYHPTALSKCPCNLHSDLPPENAISNLILIFLFFFLILLLSSLILQIYMLSLPLHLRRFLFPEKPAMYQTQKATATYLLAWCRLSLCFFSDLKTFQDPPISPCCYARFPTKTRYLPFLGCVRQEAHEKKKKKKGLFSRATMRYGSLQAPPCLGTVFVSDFDCLLVIDQVENWKLWTAHGS